ncbi:hypothetical protein TDB9533_03310 [Thalassocella blandensis]|nr:hypothetical protein TDB9533_03310 [Thalassocella blandensis]
MIYELLKTLHLSSLFIWLGGTFGVAIALMIQAKQLDSLRVWDRYVTSVAMVFSWVFGLTLAYYTGWINSPWLWLKVFFVFMLSGVHGSLSGKLSSADLEATQGESNMNPPSVRRIQPELLVMLVFIPIIVSLVVFKPF